MLSRICAAFLICASLPASAQPAWVGLPGSSAPKPEGAPDTTHGIIRLDVNVTDKSGNPVAGLTQQDFKLLDNSQPAKIVTFHAFDGMDARPDPPTEVILVIDELTLPPVQAADAKREAENFLRLHNGQLTLPVRIYRLNDKGLTASIHHSTDGNALADEIEHHAEPNTIWKTSALEASKEQTVIVHVPATFTNSFEGEARRRELNQLHALVALGSIALEERRKHGRKVMFWLSSGWKFDGQPGPGMFDLVTELSTRLREARIDLWMATKWPLYDIYQRPLLITKYIYPNFLEGVTPENADFTYLFLYVLAAETGGGRLEPHSNLNDELEKQIKKESTFYSLTFDPARTNVVDEYHNLKVEVDKPDLIARTTIGYFDEPVFYDQRPTNLQSVSVQQLEDMLLKAGGSSGGEMVRTLSNMELTERLSTWRREKLQSTLKNKGAREALAKLADKSAFLSPPSSEIPANPPPDTAAQQKIIARAIQYVDHTMRRLPNLFTERTTIQFHERPPRSGQTWKTIGGDQSLYQDQTSKATVVFRDGKETADAKVSEAGLLNKNEWSLNTVGTFGAVLATVIVGASEQGSELAWSRWEQGTNGTLAVFRYRVPRETPLYLVSSNFLTIDDRVARFEKKSPYHGEFAVDPESGAILRLTIQADLEERLPLKRSDIMVEYAPVVIGGITYICPKRSVSISRSRTTMDIHQWAENFKVYAPFDTKLSVMAYDKYHLFHPTSRMLPGFTPAPDNK